MTTLKTYTRISRGFDPPGGIIKFVFSLVLSLFPIFGFASNIVGTYIDQGKKLSIRIVDDPSLYPFEGGRLWSIIASDQRIRSIVFDDMKITCDAAPKVGTNDASGSCRIVISVDKLKNHTEVLSYRLIGDSAQDLNSLFANEPFSLSLDLQRNSDRALSIRVDRMLNYFSLIIYKTILSE